VLLDESAQQFLETYSVVSPAGDGRVLTPSGGAVYVAALPFVLTGTRFWAELSEHPPSYQPLFAQYFAGPAANTWQVALFAEVILLDPPKEVPQRATKCTECGSEQQPFWVNPKRNTLEWWEDPSPYWMCGDCGGIRCF